MTDSETSSEWQDFYSVVLKKEKVAVIMTLRPEKINVFLSDNFTIR